MNKEILCIKLVSGK